MYTTTTATKAFEILNSSSKNHPTVTFTNPEGVICTAVAAKLMKKEEGIRFFGIKATTEAEGPVLLDLGMLADEAEVMVQMDEEDSKVWVTYSISRMEIAGTFDAGISIHWNTGWAGETIEVSRSIDTWKMTSKIDMKLPNRIEGEEEFELYEAAHELAIRWFKGFKTDQGRIYQILNEEVTKRAEQDQKRDKLIDEADKFANTAAPDVTNAIIKKFRLNSGSQIAFLTRLVWNAIRNGQDGKGIKTGDNERSAQAMMRYGILTQVGEYAYEIKPEVLAEAGAPESFNLTQKLRIIRES